jgi:dCMP deaminase
VHIIDPHAVIAHRPAAGPRPDWHEYFMAFAALAATRASCVRRRVGAVIVKDNMVLTTGYNGAPRGMAHAAEVGCLRDRLGVPSGQRHELCRGLHAEQNAIIQAARHGLSIAGGTLYCTTHPCVICLKMIINAGLVAAYYTEGYADEIVQEILAESQFPVYKLDPKMPPTPPEAAERRPGLPIVPS